MLEPTQYSYPVLQTEVVEHLFCSQLLENCCNSEIHKTYSLPKKSEKIIEINNYPSMSGHKILIVKGYRTTGDRHKHTQLNQ